MASVELGSICDVCLTALSFEVRMTSLGRRPVLTDRHLDALNLPFAADGHTANIRQQ
jgi:hypothetical protein